MSLIYSEEKGKALSVCPPQCCLVCPVSSLPVPTQAQVQALSAVRLNSIQRKPITFETFLVIWGLWKWVQGRRGAAGQRGFDVQQRSLLRAFCG